MDGLSIVVAYLTRNGFAVNNLFQRPDGLWQANVRDPHRVSDFAVDADPAAALIKALAKHDLEKALAAQAECEVGGGLHGAVDRFTAYLEAMT